MGKRHMGNQRCSICNKVSSEEIMDDHGDSYYGTFVLSSDKVTLTCGECMSEIADVRKDFDIMDEEREIELFGDRSEYYKYAFGHKRPPGVSPEDWQKEMEKRRAGGYRDLTFEEHKALRNRK